MSKNKQVQFNDHGDQAPTWKDVLLVVVIVAAMTAFAWIAYYKLGWLH